MGRAGFRKSQIGNLEVVEEEEEFRAFTAPLLVLLGSQACSLSRYRSIHQNIGVSLLWPSVNPQIAVLGVPAHFVRAN